MGDQHTIKSVFKSHVEDICNIFAIYIIDSVWNV